MDDKLPAAFARHTVNILRVAAGHRQQALAVLQNLEEALVGKVATAKNLEKGDRFRALLTQTRDSIRESYETLATTQGQNLRKLAATEGAATVKGINTGIGVPIANVGVTENYLEKVADGKTIYGHSSREWWQKQSQGLQFGFQGQMQQGLLMGETNDELVRRIRGTKAGGFKDGLMETSRREAAALVRTAAISTANAARLATLEGMDDMVKGIQWLATLDGRTTLICKGLSGKVWKLPGYEPVGHDKAFPGPIAHWQCRSTQIPVMKSWEEMSGVKLPSVGDEELLEAVKRKLAERGMRQDQIDAATVRTRASMDGQVPEDLTMGKWLGGRDDAFIEETLGKGRARLWDRGNGKLSMADLTDQTNRPLTIDQLRENIEKGKTLPETEGVDIHKLLKTPIPKPQPRPEPPAPPAPEPEPEPAPPKPKPKRETKSNEEKAAEKARREEAKRRKQEEELAERRRKLKEFQEGQERERQRKLEEKQRAKEKKSPPAPTGKPGTGPAVSSVMPDGAPPMAKRAAAVIDSVHSDGTLRDMWSVGAPSGDFKDADGLYYPDSGQIKMKDNLNEGASLMTFTHEMGHKLDWEALGENNGTWGTRHSEMSEIREAVMQTKAYAGLAETRDKRIALGVEGTEKYYGYMVQGPELWARAYAQYIAEESGNGPMLAFIDKVRDGKTGYWRNAQWDKNDFAPVRSAINRLFKAKGWRQ